MYRNWKNAAAMGLAVMLGCMMPMSTMLAAETEAETGAGSADGDVVYGDETAADIGDAASEENGSAPDGENVPEARSLPNGENASEAGSLPNGEDVPEDADVSGGENTLENGGVTNGENTSEDENVPDAETPGGENADGIGDAGVLSAPPAKSGAGTEDAEDAGSVNAPEIIIKRDGENVACPLGGEVTFEYVNNWGTLFEVYVDQSDESVSVYSYMDKVTDMEAGAATEEQVADWPDKKWGGKQTPPMSFEPLNEGCYVIYVKVEAGGQTCYARSNGVVVDTKSPAIKGVEEGMTYSEGTLFQVEDANLDYVLVNEQPAVSENGNYKVAANGTSCVIRAKDKAGNETVRSIIVSGTETPEPSEPEEPGTPDDSKVISESGEYTLKAGVTYHLAEGNWKVDGDKSVYRGGNDFYVAADGSYKFTK